MKNILKIFCVYILLGFASIIYLLITMGTDYSTILNLFSTGYVEQNIVQNFAYFFLKSIPLIITITVCAIRMSKKNENILIRLVPLYLIVALILNAMMTFINLEDASEDFFNVIKGIYNFISYSNYFILPVSILSNLNPNNQIARILKIVGYVLIGISAASILSLYIEIFLANKVPKVYSYESFNFTSIAQSLGTTIKIVVLSVVGEISAIMLGFMANYAFESETLESDVLDMEELMKQADQVAEQRQKELYARKEKKLEIDRSVSETSGRMNVDNQLGAHSNVGVVNKDEQTTSIIEKALPSAGGPVMNSAAINQAPPAPEPAPTPVVTTPTAQPQPVATVAATPTPVQTVPAPTPVAQPAPVAQAPVAVQPTAQPVQPAQPAQPAAQPQVTPQAPTNPS